MSVPHDDVSSYSNHLYEDHAWNELASRLRPRILRLIYSYKLPLWLGQEQDIADDVLQETFIRIFKYMDQATLSGGRPIESLESFCMAVARNYICDIWRKQRRLVRLSTLTENHENCIPDISTSTDPAEVALVHLMSRDTLKILVRIIVDFPPGQRRALLIDLAQRSDCDEESEPLHIIFLEFGINLLEYKLLYPGDAVARSRHASLLSIAYKRLRQIFYERKAKFVA